MKRFIAPITITLTLAIAAATGIVHHRGSTSESKKSLERCGVAIAPKQFTECHINGEKSNGQYITGGVALDAVISTDGDVLTAKMYVPNILNQLVYTVVVIDVSDGSYHRVAYWNGQITETSRQFPVSTHSDGDRFTVALDEVVNGTVVMTDAHVVTFKI